MKESSKIAAISASTVKRRANVVQSRRLFFCDPGNFFDRFFLNQDAMKNKFAVARTRMQVRRVNFAMETAGMLEKSFREAHKGHEKFSMFIRVQQIAPNRIK